jgi:hypothetical protein
MARSPKPDSSKMMDRQKGTPCSSRVGVGHGGDDTTPDKTYVHKTSEMPPTGLINRQRIGCKGKELVFGTWNFRTLYNRGGLLSLLSQFFFFSIYSSSSFGVFQLMLPEAPQPYGLLYYPRIGLSNFFHQFRSAMTTKQRNL